MALHITPGTSLAVQADRAGGLRLWWRHAQFRWHMRPMALVPFVFRRPGVDWWDSNRREGVSPPGRIPTNASQVLALILRWHGRCEIRRLCLMLYMGRGLETNISLPRQHVPTLKKWVPLRGGYV